MKQPDPSSIVRLRVTGTPVEAMELLRAIPVEARRVIEREGQVTMDIFVERALLDKINAIGLHIDKLIDTRDPRRRDLAPVGEGNRFGGGRFPQGLGELEREG